MTKEILYRFFQGNASTDEMRLVKHWVELSDENHKQFRRERKLFDAMILVSPSKEIMRPTPQKKKGNYYIRQFLQVASIIVVTIAVTIGVFSLETKIDNEELAMQCVIVPAGQRVNLNLPDGSNIWLNAGTTLQYPVTFLKNKREVILDGEAWFEIAHNEKSPFTVRTHALDIEVLGTTFNVEAYSAENAFEASLLEGSIKVKSPDDEQIVRILSPNDKIILKDGELTVSKIDDYNEFRWKEGLYCFKNKPVTDILKDLERYYDITIILNKKKIQDVKLTGKFLISAGLDYALRVLQDEIAFTFQRDNEKEIVYIN